MYPEPYWLLALYAGLSSAYAFGCIRYLGGGDRGSQFSERFWGVSWRTTLVFLIYRFYSVLENYRAWDRVDHVSIVLQSLVIGSLSLAFFVEFARWRAARARGGTSGSDGQSQTG